MATFSTTWVPLAILVLSLSSCGPERRTGQEAPLSSPNQESPVEQAVEAEGLQIEVNGDEFRSGDLIQARITNQSGRDLFTDDMKTVCSVLTLERQEGSGWKAVGDCLAERAPRTVKLAAGSDLNVSIDTTSSFFRDGGPLLPGLYRFRLEARTAPELGDGETFVVTSPLFSVI